MRPHAGLRSSGVLIVSQATDGGVAVCVRDLVEAAIRSGFDITVACPSAGNLARWAREQGAAWEPIEMRRSPHPSDLPAAVQVRRLARTSSLVHLHSSKAGAVGRLALASLGQRRPPSIFTPHGWSWLIGGWLAPAYLLIERSMIHVTNAVVAVSEEERSAGQAALGRRAARIRVNPNGVDIGHFRQDGPVASRTNDPLVVSVGRLSHQRAPDVALAALALMRTPAARLRLVGEGPERATIEEQAAALGIADRVELVGFRSDVAPELRAADVVMIPSRYDGMALVMLEAMACGSPIVATRVPGTSALGSAGVLVPVEDARSLAGAIDALLADSARREALGKAARTRVVEHYALHSSIAGILRLWRDLGAAPEAESRLRYGRELRGVV